MSIEFGRGPLPMDYAKRRGLRRRSAANDLNHKSDSCSAAEESRVQSVSLKARYFARKTFPNRARNLAILGSWPEGISPGSKAKGKGILFDFCTEPVNVRYAE
jgi:hypothetical protein